MSRNKECWSWERMQNANLRGQKYRQLSIIVLLACKILKDLLYAHIWIIFCFVYSSTVLTLKNYLHQKNLEDWSKLTPLVSDLLVLSEAAKSKHHKMMEVIQTTYKDIVLHTCQNYQIQANFSALTPIAMQFFYMEATSAGSQPSESIPTDSDMGGLSVEINQWRMLKVPFPLAIHIEVYLC